jgi:hypothetical protein
MENTSPSAENVTPPAAATPATRPSTPVWRLTTLGRLTVVGGAAVLIVAALAIPRRLPAPSASAPRGSQQERTVQPANVTPISAPVPSAPAMTEAPVGILPEAPEAVSPDAVPQGVQEPSRKAAASKTEKHRIAASRKSTASIATPLSDTAVKEDSETMPTEPEPLAATPIPESVSTGTVVPPVTITGCLEISVNEDSYRLINTEGVDAPKSRSWRTGFLKKRSASVVLIEPPDPQALQMQVGKRVAATGLLTSRELKVSSLRVVGPSCN